MKSEVYSWRVSSDLKSSLEREARRRKVSVAAALDSAAREWLLNGASSNEEEEQRRLRKAASKWLGTLASGNTQRSESVARTVRDRLRQRYGR